MDSTVLVALIIAFGGIVTQTVIAAVSKRTTEAIINYRVDQLEEKVNKHNSVIERMYKIEGRVTTLEEKENI